MAQIEKVVSCFDELSATRVGSYIVPNFGIYWLYTAANYEPAPSEIYFEAVLSTSLSGSPAYAELHNGTSQIVELSTNSTSASWVRSANIVGSIVNGAQYRVRIKSLGTGATTTLKAARIIIIQNGTISKTETIYQFGSSFITGSTSYTNDTAKTYYYWDSTQFDGNVTCYFEGLINNQAAGGTTYAILMDTSGSVVASEISVTGTTETRVRSGSFVLSDGLVNIRLRASSSNARLRQARLIITQTGSPTKMESYYPVSKTFTSIVTGSALSPFSWSNDIWDVGSKEIYYQAWLNTVSGTSFSTLYDYSAGGDIETLSEASSATITREISGSLVLPNDFYDTFYSGTNGTGFGTDVIIRAVLTSASGGSSLIGGSSLLAGYGNNDFYAYLLNFGITEFSANGQLIPFGKLNIPSSVLMTGDGSLFITSLSIVQSAIEILGSGYLSLIPTITIPANASLGGAAYLIATAFIQALVEGQVILSGQGDSILNALNLINSNTTLSGNGLLILNSLVLIYANEILLGRGDIEINSRVLVNALVELLGNGSLSLDGRLLINSLVDLYGSGNLQPSGLLLINSLANLYGLGDLESNASLTINSLSNLYGSGNLQTDGILVIPSQTQLSGFGYLIATAFIQGLVSGDVSLYGRGDLLPNALKIIFGQDLLAGTGNITPTSILTILNNVTLEGLAFLIVSGFIVTPTVTINGEAILYGREDLILSALNIVNGYALNSAESILTAQGLTGVLANAILDGRGNVESNAILLMTAVVALYGAGAIFAIGTIPSDVLASITPLSRTLVIPAEDRVYIIDQDGRVFVIKADRRNYDIED